MGDSPALIDITVNGRTCQVESGLSLDGLLTSLDLPTPRVAVERNRQIVPRGRFELEPVEPGDSFEIVTLVGGG